VAAVAVLSEDRPHVLVVANLRGRFGGLRGSALKALEPVNETMSARMAARNKGHGKKPRRDGEDGTKRVSGRKR